MLNNNLLVALKNLRFPENAGASARACANMGVNRLCLVSPRNWDLLKAWPTATACGQPVLRNLKIYEDCKSAFADCHAVYGTNARTGGWRKSASDPEKICGEIAERLARNEKIALLFGPEDAGLSNEDLSICAGIIHIDTEKNASSLNLAQAVLLVLYELRASLKKEKIYKKEAHAIALEEQLLLEEKLKATLEKLHCLSGNNPDYAFRVWHDIICRARLRRHEFDAVMGLCRQIAISLGKNFLL